MDVIIPTNLVWVLVDPAIPTSSFKMITLFFILIIIYDLKAVSWLMLRRSMPVVNNCDEQHLESYSTKSYQNQLKLKGNNIISMATSTEHHKIKLGGGLIGMSMV